MEILLTIAFVLMYNRYAYLKFSKYFPFMECIDTKTIGGANR